MDKTLTDASNVKRCQTCGTNFPLSYNLKTCHLDGGELLVAAGDGFVGTLINRRFEIQSLVGSGNSGSVYSATDQELGRRVAVKVLHASSSADKDLAQRFQREAKMAGNLNHPGIVTIFDRGLLPTGQPFIVMEYLNGQSLGEIIARQGHLDSLRAGRIALQMCDALHYAHKAGVIHRDLKPENVLVLEGDFAKIVDFGLAKWLNSQDSLSKSGTAFGTPQFMSPEQCRGGTIDQRSDIYCLGLIIYKMFVGCLPFKSRTMFEAMSMHILEAPAPFSQTCPELRLPASLEEIVMRCLAKDPNDRFGDCAELKSALELALPSSKGTSKPETPSDGRKSWGLKKVLMTAFASGIAIGAALLVVRAWDAISGPRSSDNTLNRSPEVSAKRSVAGNLAERSAQRAAEATEKADRAPRNSSSENNRSGHPQPPGNAEQKPLSKGQGLASSPHPSAPPANAALASQPAKPTVPSKTAREAKLIAPSRTDHEVKLTAQSKATAEATSRHRIPSSARPARGNALVFNNPGGTEQFSKESSTLDPNAALPASNQTYPLTKAQKNKILDHGYRMPVPASSSEALKMLAQVPNECTVFTFVGISDAAVMESVLKYMGQHFPNVSSIALVNCPLTETMSAQLAKFELANLFLQEMVISDAVMKRLNLSLPSILGFDGSTVSDASLQRIPLDKINGLSLRRTAITSASAARLSKMEQLEAVSVAKTKFDDAGVRILSRTGIKSLDLESTPITDGIVDSLVSMPKLRELSIARTNLTEAGLIKLLKAPHLVRLDLSGYHMTKALLEAFLRNSTLTDLRMPNLSAEDNTALTKAQININSQGRFFRTPYLLRLR
jgi:serine/threonine protein kinase